MSVTFLRAASARVEGDTGRHKTIAADVLDDEHIAWTVMEQLGPMDAHVVGGTCRSWHQAALSCWPKLLHKAALFWSESTLGHRSCGSPQSVITDSALQFVLHGRGKATSGVEDMIRSLTSCGMHLNCPQVIAEHESKLFIVETTRHRVQIFSCAGAPLGTLGSDAQIQLHKPVSVCIFRSVVVVAECCVSSYDGASCGRITLFTAHGAPVQRIHTPFKPSSLCADEDNVYACDFDGKQIYSFASCSAV